MKYRIIEQTRGDGSITYIIQQQEQEFTYDKNKPLGERWKCHAWQTVNCGAPFRDIEYARHALSLLRGTEVIYTREVT